MASESIAHTALGRMGYWRRTHSFMRQHTYVEILSTREVWRAQKRRKCGSSNSSLLSAFQTSQVLNISTWALLKHEIIVYNIIQAINEAVNLKFY